MRFYIAVLGSLSILALCVCIACTSPVSDATETVPDGSSYTYITYGTEHPNYYCKITEVQTNTSILYIPTVLEGYDVKILASGAFENCPASSIIIPKNVTLIENGAFTKCTNLDQVYFLGECPSMENAFPNGTAFYCLPDNGDYPPGTVVIETTTVNGILYGHFPDGWMALGGTPTGETIEICPMIDEEPVVSVGPYSFSGTMQSNGEVLRRTDIKEVIIPDTVGNIRERSFYYCDVEKVTFSESIVAIHDESFRAAYHLDDLSFPDSLEYIGFECFRDCHDLKILTLTNNITFLGEGAFYICESLKTACLQTSSLPNRIFGYCSNLESIELLGSPTSIGNLAFYNCFKVNNVKIPNSVKTIGNASFFSCTSLNSIDLGSVETIGNEGFRNCSSLSTISLPGSLKSMGTYSFADCTVLTSVKAYGPCPEGNSTVFLNDPATIHCSQEHYDSWNNSQFGIAVESDLNADGDHWLLWITLLSILIIGIGTIILFRKLH